MMKPIFINFHFKKIVYILIIFFFLIVILKLKMVLQFFYLLIYPVVLNFINKEVSVANDVGAVAEETCDLLSIAT